MILLAPNETDTPDALRASLQQAVLLELATLPPYLYAFFSAGEENQPAIDRMHHIWHEEMVHMLLACNILNAIGGSPVIADAAVVPTYPGPLPGGIDPHHAIHLYAFSKKAMKQGMDIEEPVKPIDIPVAAGLMAAAPGPTTIGAFYDSLRIPLRTMELPWDERPERQLGDLTVFPGEVFPVRGPDDAVRAIDHIVSEGEGTTETPLDFNGDVSHYYRFEEMYRNKVLQRAPDQDLGFAWGGALGIRWAKAVKAIDDPALLDLRRFPEAQACQDRCDRAYTSMLRELELAVTGYPDRLGHAIADMLTLAREAERAFATPFGSPARSAGPAFRYRPDLLP